MPKNVDEITKCWNITNYTNMYSFKMISQQKDIMTWRGKQKKQSVRQMKNACSRLCPTGFYKKLDNVDNLEALEFSIWNIIR